ncbi:MAG: hypothetical protein EOO61_13770, partial [Hymenobacter sp.]
MSLIATNTISQGGARKGGLEVILSEKSEVSYAVSSMKWPGLASVEISLVVIQKFPVSLLKKELDGEAVNYIDSHLSSDKNVVVDEKPFAILNNSDDVSIGTFVSGLGFILTAEQATLLLESNANNAEVIRPYFNGSDLNNLIGNEVRRWVINFKNWPLRRLSYSEWDELTNIQKEDIVSRLRKGLFVSLANPEYGGPVANDYPECLQIIERLVKPERLLLKDAASKEKWWLHARSRPELYKKLSSLSRTLVIARTSKTLAFDFRETDVIFNDNSTVIPIDKSHMFSVLQSNLHISWIWQYCTTMKTDPIYGPVEVFHNFPFPDFNSEHCIALDKIGENYHNYRKELTCDLRLGLTDTYNLFHTPDLTPTALAKAAKLTSETTARAAELLQRLLHLRELHRQLDEAVAIAYGWSDLPLAHGFHEQDYLPENDRTRYTISPAARREVLRRLLQLNHEIHAQEVAEQTALAAAAKAAKPARKSKDQATAPLPL